MTATHAAARTTTSTIGMHTTMHTSTMHTTSVHTSTTVNER